MAVTRWSLAGSLGCARLALWAAPSGCARLARRAAPGALTEQPSCSILAFFCVGPFAQTRRFSVGARFFSRSGFCSICRLQIAGFFRRVCFESFRIQIVAEIVDFRICKNRFSNLQNLGMCKNPEIYHQIAQIDFRIKNDIFKSAKIDRKMCEIDLQICENRGNRVSNLQKRYFRIC